MRRKSTNLVEFHFFDPPGLRVEAVGRNRGRGEPAPAGQWWVKVEGTKSRAVLMPVDDMPAHWILQLSRFGPRKGNLP